MLNLNQFLNFDSQNEHVLEHDLLKKKNFSPPKIYNAKGDLSKRWYVYFSFRNPETDKLQRMKNVYGKTNNYKTKEERLTVLTVYRKKLLDLLKRGYDPFGDNTLLYNNLNGHQVPKLQLTKVEAVEQNNEESSMSIKEAFEFGLKLKEKLINSTTKRGYQNKVKQFLTWLDKHHPKTKSIRLLNKKILTEFLNDVLNNTSARNRNNFRTELSSIMQVLEDNEKVSENLLKKIPVLKSKPIRHKAYTEELQSEIFNYLCQEDGILLLFIKFASYSFMRPIEVSRIRVEDIDLENKTVQFEAKNSSLKTKIIPEVLWSELPDLSKMKKNHFLFTPKKIGGDWDAESGSRRDHFTKRYKRVVKEHFKLNENYTIYSFRHTYTVKVYRKLRKSYAPFEAKTRLMLITGHTSMTALEKYLRDIDAELPEDYSEML